MGDKLFQVIFIVISFILLMEIIYFLTCSFWYIYHKPIYRAFWAAFCLNPPSKLHIIHQPTHNAVFSKSRTSQKEEALISQSKTTTMIHLERTSHTNDHAESAIRPERDTVSTDSKRNAFFKYGLETIAHSILTPLYLVGLLMYIVVRFKIQFITYNNQWSLPQNIQFCSFAFRFAVALPTTHYWVQIILMLQPLKHAMLNPLTETRFRIRRRF
eukprot:899334_1